MSPRTLFCHVAARLTDALSLQLRVSALPDLLDSYNQLEHSSGR